MRMAVGVGMSRGAPRVWTPFQLPDNVLLFGTPPGLSAVRPNVDGSGTLVGDDDNELAAHLADLSSYGRPLVQATEVERPIVGASPLGRGIALFSEGTRRLISASNVAGLQYFFAAVSFVGANTVRGAGDEPAAFATASQSYAATRGAVDAAHSLLVGLEGTNALWAFDGPAFINGAETYQVGRQRDRVLAEVHRTTPAATGALALFTSGADVIPARGVIHQVFGLSALATPEQRAKVREYMTWHRKGPKVIFSVDSLLAGYQINADDSPPSHLWRRRWRGCVPIANLSIQGQTMVAALSTDPAKIDANKNLGINVCVLLGGANDIANGASAATVWARIQSYITMAKSKGCRVVVCSVPDGTGTYTSEQRLEIAALRALIAAGWAAAGADAYVDLFGTLDGVPGVLQGDGVHFTVTGAELVADDIGAAVDPLLV